MIRGLLQHLQPHACRAFTAAGWREEFTFEVDSPACRPVAASPARAGAVRVLELGSARLARLVVIVVHAHLVGVGVGVRVSVRVRVRVGVRVRVRIRVRARARARVRAASDLARGPYPYPHLSPSNPNPNLARGISADAFGRFRKVPPLCPPSPM